MQKGGIQGGAKHFGCFYLKKIIYACVFSTLEMYNEIKGREPPGRVSLILSAYFCVSNPFHVAKVGLLIAKRDAVVLLLTNNSRFKKYSVTQNQVDGQN